MKVTKIPPPNIPKSHYKWAGIEEEKEEVKYGHDQGAVQGFELKRGYNRKKSANLETLYTSPTISATENVSTTKCKVWFRGDYQDQNTFMNEFLLKVTPS